MFCMKCGEQLREDNVCPNCGFFFDESKYPQKRNTVTQIPQQPQEQQPSDNVQEEEIKTYPRFHWRAWYVLAINLLYIPVTGLFGGIAYLVFYDWLYLPEEIVAFFYLIGIIGFPFLMFKIAFAGVDEKRRKASRSTILYALLPVILATAIFIVTLPISATVARIETTKVIEEMNATTETTTVESTTVEDTTSNNGTDASAGDVAVEVVETIFVATMEGILTATVYFIEAIAIMMIYFFFLLVGFFISYIIAMLTTVGLVMEKLRKVNEKIEMSEKPMMRNVGYMPNINYNYVQYIPAENNNIVNEGVTYVPDENIPKASFVVGRDMPSGKLTFIAIDDKGGMVYLYSDEGKLINKIYFRTKEKIKVKSGWKIEMYNCIIDEQLLS